MRKLLIVTGLCFAYFNVAFVEETPAPAAPPTPPAAPPPKTERRHMKSTEFKTAIIECIGKSPASERKACMMELRKKLREKTLNNQ